MKLNIKDIKDLIKEELTRAKTLLEEPLQEAIKGNKYPFKAIFVFGPAGAGKSFLSDEIIGVPSEFRVSNPDISIERQFGDFGLSMKFAGEEDLGNFLQQQSFRQKMQQKTRKETENWLLTATPVVFDTTGEKTKKMIDRINELAKAGYDIAVMQINVPEEISVQRDQDRARTVGAPTATINQRYQREVAKERRYFNALSNHPRVTMLGDDIYANLFNLQTGKTLPGITDDMLNAMTTKDGNPYTPEYATSLLDEIKNNLRGFLLLKEPNNPTGQTLYAGMLALISATGGRAGNTLTDFASVAQDKELMAIPEIKAAAETIAELGGAKEMFMKAQRGAEVAGQEFGTAVPTGETDADGNPIMREPTGRELGTTRNEEDFETWRQRSIASIRARDDLNADEKKKRIEKLATMSKDDRYTDGPKLTKEQFLSNAIREILKEILFNKGK